MPNNEKSHQGHQTQTSNKGKGMEDGMKTKSSGSDNSKTNSGNKNSGNDSNRSGNSGKNM